MLSLSNLGSILDGANKDESRKKFFQVLTFELKDDIFFSTFTRGRVRYSMH
jgi:hypothetical protein